MPNAGCLERQAPSTRQVMCLEEYLNFIQFFEQSKSIAIFRPIFQLTENYMLKCGRNVCYMIYFCHFSAVENFAQHAVYLNCIT
jgi:hypothetical protein